MFSLTSHMYWIFNEILPPWGSSEFLCYIVNTERYESGICKQACFVGGYYFKNSLDYIHDYLAYPARIPNYWLHGYKSEEITKQPSSVWNTLKHGFVGMNTVWMGTLYVCLWICVGTTVPFFFFSFIDFKFRNFHWWLLFRILNFFYWLFLQKY